MGVNELTFTLFERLGLLLIIAFVMTRTTGFRSLLNQKFSKKMMFVHMLIFGLFGIFATMMGVVLDTDFQVVDQFVWAVSENDFAVSLSLVAIVIAGLLGGPIVGLGAGLIAGIHFIFIGGIGWEANFVVNPLTGVLAGLTGQFFSNERVISPFKALFIGIFPPILQMQMLLILYPHPDQAIEIVDTIGLPLVLSNSLAIAIFTAIIGVVLKEQETEAASATRRAFSIAEEALPYLKKDSAQEIADGLVQLLYDRLGLAAISVANHNEIIAHKGVGSDHHRLHDKLVTEISRQALKSHAIQIAYTKAEIGCHHHDCPLEAAIIIPIGEMETNMWLLKFYFKKPQHIRPMEITLADGLGQLLNNQMQRIESEKIAAHMKDAELRNLQAQINPHFLFNTLNLIAIMFRENPDQARHITVQLAQFMRFNLSLVSKSLVSLEKELEHLAAYVAIVQARFQERLHIEMSLPEEIPNCDVPPSTLQPIIENCIEHGLKKTKIRGEIKIEMQLENERINFMITDNGVGFDKEILNDVGKVPLDRAENSGSGLYNVNQRLAHLLGDEAQLQIENLSQGGSKVSFAIPMIRDENVI